MTHEKMMEFESLLEASGERNLRSVKLTHGECPSSCRIKTVWLPGALQPLLDMGCGKKLVSRATRSSADHFVVSSMLALRWIEDNVTKKRESRAPAVEPVHANDYSRRLELFETTCKVIAVPLEVRHVA